LFKELIKLIICSKYSDLFRCRYAAKNHVFSMPRSFIELHAIFVCPETISS